MKWLLSTFNVQSVQEIKGLIWQFLKFGLVGISNTAISLGVYYLVLWINPALYMVGSILGAVLSIANAFFWNDRFVFTDGKRDFRSTLGRLGKTYVSYGGTAILSNVLLLVEVSLFNMDKRIAPIINKAITIPLNFIINKLWTFRENQ